MKTRMILGGLAAAVGGAAAVWPKYAPILIPIATFLGGWATPAPRAKEPPQP